MRSIWIMVCFLLLSQVFQPVWAGVADTDVQQQLEQELQQIHKLESTGNTTAAIKRYETLIELHPREPVLFNNLAVLMAKEGKLDAALKRLQQAMHIDKLYATVYENLSAVYVEMARGSYAKALQMGAAPQQLSLKEVEPEIVPVIQDAEKKQNTSKVAAQASASIEKLPLASKQAVKEDKNILLAVQTTPKVESKAPGLIEKLPLASKQAVKEDKNILLAVQTTPKVESKAPALIEKLPLASKQVVKKDKNILLAVQTTPKVESKAPGSIEKLPLVSKQAVKEDKNVPLTVQNIPKVESKAPAPIEKLPLVSKQAGKEDKDILLTLQSWARAWSAQQVGRYLSFYAAEFQPAKGMSRRHWVQQRRLRLARPAWVKITLNDFQIQSAGEGMARVRFLQRYQSDTYRDRTRKEIILKFSPDGWHILSERSL